MTALCYDTDLSDAEWAILAPLLASTTRRGRPRKHDLRLVLNAILYILRGGEPWRLLPHEYPPWQSVYDHFRRWCQRGTWRSINDALRTRTRMFAGRSREPHAAIIDSQTARTSEAGGERGYDGGKRIGSVANPLFQSFSYCSLSSGVEGSVFKGRHFDRSIILLCVRWYLAYNLSLRNLEELMAERGISIDHATIHRWTVHYAPLLLERFNRRRRPVTSRWHVDETYIKVRGRWMYLYRAIDSNGDTVEFWFSERRNLTAAKRFLRKALRRHGRPERIVIDGSQTNREAILSCDTESRLQDRSRGELKPIRIRQSAYLNNRIEQDHRAIKRRIRPMLGFKSTTTARVILSGIEMVHMMRKQQAKYACYGQISLADQFERLAA